MIEAPHYSAAGVRRDAAFALPADYFDGTVHEPALHQAVRAFLNNQRQGTAQTKTRSFVSGGNQKPWKQKGTGRARQGSTRAPHWRGGGTVFGPSPRDYTTAIPRKVRQLARRSALNARAREAELHVIERLLFPEPRTRDLAALLARLGVAGRKVLVLTAEHSPNVYLSGRNLPGVEVMRYADASAYDVVRADAVVVEEGAITGVIPEVEAEPEAEPAEAAPRARQPKRAAPKSAAKAAKRAKGTGAKAKRAAGKPAKSTAKAKTAKAKAAKRPAARKKKERE
ncbi:MAG TPA: 50S ribosomal protein L4 [Gemmatimonadales bacterium]|nr:50S ribosomal protein L4 [Gemmatimonadales bacterium]